MLPRVPMWWISMLGLIRLGAVPIPATTLLTPKDIAYRIELAGISAIVISAADAGKIGNFSGTVFVIEECERDLERISPGFRPPPTRASDPGLVYFTSGTTGPAEDGAAHAGELRAWSPRDGRGMALLPAARHSLESGRQRLGQGRVVEFVRSLAHGCVHFCGRCAWKVRRRRRRLRTLMARYPITTWCAPPTALRLIIRDDLAAYRCPNLRHCVSGGEPLNAVVIETWKRATGLTIYEGYGQTETVVLIANCLARGDLVRPGSMGRPTPGFEVAPLDDELNRGSGQRGRWKSRCASHRIGRSACFAEYWKNPKETAARFRGDWYLTGDCARRDEDGWYWFVSRSDDVIKSAGYRIGPFEVESALIEHPAVLEAAAVAKSDALRGAIVKAYVVLRKDCAAPTELR